jgi:hypothetical protein
MYPMEFHLHQTTETGKNECNLTVGNSPFRHIRKELNFDNNFPFLKDATENIIKSNQIYRNEKKITEITDTLRKRRICLIRAMEGRGKTFLSRIVAYQLYTKEGFDVYFVDLKNNGIRIESIEDKLRSSSDSNKKKEAEQTKNEKTKCLLVFENAHSFSELDKLTEIIDKWREEENSNNLFFLLNARYTTEDYDPLLEWSARFVVKLNPDMEDIEGIICLYENITNAQREKKRQVIERTKFDQFITDKIFNLKTKSQNENISANLRLLNIYLRVWQEDDSIDSIDKIEDDKIFRKFSDVYRIGRIKFSEIQILLFLSSIYQFDVPFYADEKNHEECNYLSELTQDGRIYVSDKGCFHLPHSIDALWLCKTICDFKNYNYVGKTSEYVKKYIQFMLDSPDPRQFESNFIQLISGLASKSDLFSPLIKELTDGNDKWVRNIIEKLNSGFVFVFFNTLNYEELSKVRFEFYKENKKIFRTALLNSGPVVCHLLNKNLKKYYKYQFLTNDIFENTEDLSIFLKKIDLSLSSIRELLENISEISSKHRNIIEKYRNNRNKEAIKIYDYYFYSAVQSEISAIRIDNKWVNLFYSFQDISINISKINKYGFYFEHLSWKHLGKFINKIDEYFNKTNDEKCIKLIRRIVKEILTKKGSFEKATAKQFAFFLHHIESIDQIYYGRILNEECVITDIKRRIQEFSYSKDELYLLSHFIFKEWCIPEVKELMESADESEILLIKQWYNDVLLNNNNNIDIEKGTLLYYIKEFFLL